MSGCREFRDQLSAHLDGALEPREQAALEAHLAGCGACREALEGLGRTVARLRALEPVEPPPWLAERILARVGRTPRPGRLRLLASRPQLQAAALVLICFTGLLVLKVAGPRRTVPPPAFEPTLPPREATPPASGREAPVEAGPLPKAKAAKPVPPRLESAPRAPELAPPAPEPPPAAPGAAPAPYQIRELSASQDAARSKTSARKASAGSLAEVSAVPDVTFRLEVEGDPTDAVREAVLRNRGMLAGRGERWVGAELDRRDLPALRTALEKLGRVVTSDPGNRSGLLQVKISW